MKKQASFLIFIYLSAPTLNAQDMDSSNTSPCFPDSKRLEQLNTLPASLDSMWIQAITTADILQAGQAEFAYADSVLNVIYAETLRSLECLKNSLYWDEKLVDKLEQSLKEARRAWIVKRDAESEFFQLSARGGTIGNQWYSSEVLEATLERNAELIGFLEHLEWVDSF